MLYHNQESYAINGAAMHVYNKVGIGFSRNSRKGLTP